jgi:hypothetical protein
VSNDYRNVPPVHPGMSPLGLSEPRQPWWKARWLLVCAAVVIGVAVGAGISGGGTKTKIVAGPTTTTTATATRAVTQPAVTVTAHPTRTVTKTFTPQPASSFGDGTYVVGTDIQPGRYRTNGAGDDPSLGCYWSRDGDLSGENILANGIIRGPTTVDVKSGDAAFEVSGGCQWARVG